MDYGQHLTLAQATPYTQETLHPIDTTYGPMPKEMNNPFSYKPHPLCIAISKQLQEHLTTRWEWREEIDQGKMFGILVVDTGEKIGYLAAYSGQIGGRSDWEGFVPAVYDYLQPNGYFKHHEAEITHINQAIAKLETDEGIMQAQRQIDLLQTMRQETIARYQGKMKEAKARRDHRRAEGNLSQEEEVALTKESQFMKAELRRLKKSLATKTALEETYDAFQADLARLRHMRKQLSDALQQWLFSQFKMLNASRETCDLPTLFGNNMPPAGSGECCEPKLLQYAYRHGYKPLQIAMFWWGASPKEEIRHHLQFYPACHGKCKPILRWMLPAASPYIYNNKVEKDIELLFEDPQIGIVYKPGGMLSVPGKNEAPSVYSFARKRFAIAEGPLIVHRLDMSTSGIMVIAKTTLAYHRLQEQFTRHEVEKKYIALICCSHAIPQKGRIALPLMPDLADRPRQKVSHEHGKTAITTYRVIGKTGHYVRIALYPQTGRTHQLRIHCAHQEGLAAPILGDPLYGKEPASRLYLHAESISFRHPTTGEKLYFERKADF